MPEVLRRPADAAKRVKSRRLGRVNVHASVTLQIANRPGRVYEYPVLLRVTHGTALRMLLDVERFAAGKAERDGADVRIGWSQDRGSPDVYIGGSSGVDLEDSARPEYVAREHGAGGAGIWRVMRADGCVCNVVAADEAGALAVAATVAEDIWK